MITSLLRISDKLLEQFFFEGNDDLSIILGMSYQMFLAFVSIDFIDPNSFFSTYQVSVLIIGSKKVC